MKQYIFIDIDGTLLDHKGIVPESAMRAITQAQANGHKVFVNTGRAKSGMPKAVSELPFNGFVYAAGTVVEIGNEQIFFDVLESSDVLSISKLVEEYKIGFSMEGYNRSFIDEKAKGIFEALNFMADKPDMLVHHKHYEPENDLINKFALFADNGEVFKLIEASLPEHLKIIIHDKRMHGVMLAEIIRSDANKATGIEKVLEFYGAQRSQTICFGDSPNDFDMVKYCNVGVCMEDGSDELKAIADDIAKPAGDDGIYRYLDEMGLFKGSVA